MTTTNDVRALRELVRRYLEATHDPVQDERRALWTRLNSLKRTRPLVMATFGMHNVWCRDVFADGRKQCQDPFYRGHERALRMGLFQYETGDDCVQEPWLTVGATLKGGTWRSIWGVAEASQPSEMDGGAWKFDPPIKEWADPAKLAAPVHDIDQDATARDLARLQDAVGDLIDIDLVRGPACQGFTADISTNLAGLRGLEQLMIDMYESPNDLHRLLAFMRDGILADQQQAEDAGDFSLTTQGNQAMVYCEELKPTRPSSGARQRRDLWCHCAAQEFTLISPEMHNEFLLQYQLPIIRNFGLSAYGCCEDLTRKIDMLRQIPNLRHIAITPVADVAECAEQIGTDYVASWRPNPTDMVCTTWDEDRIRRTTRQAMEALKASCLTIHLKDIETVQGEPDRLRRWVETVRGITDGYA